MTNGNLPAGARAPARAEAAPSFPASISVIVPARNREQLLEPCLLHLRQAADVVLAQGVSVEIVVTDDASTDGTRRVVEEAMALPGDITVKLVALDRPHGPARARNAALERAVGDLIVFIDSDVIVTPGVLEAHWRLHRDGYAAGQRVYGVGTLVNVPSLEVALQQPAPTVWDHSQASLDTANASVLKADLAEVGNFDAGFHVYGWEDLDLGRRLKKLGLARSAVTDAVAYHIQPPIEDRESLKARLHKERERGITAVHFMDKHREFSARLTAQDTPLHRFMSWCFRMGGLVHEDNVLNWVGWARRRGLDALEKMWLAGVLTHAYLDSLQEAKRTRVPPSSSAAAPPDDS